MDEPNLTDRVALLRGGWLFSECTDDEIERIAALAHGMRVPAGHVVVREGDDAEIFLASVIDIGHHDSQGAAFGCEDLRTGRRLSPHQRWRQST